MSTYSLDISAALDTKLIQFSAANSVPVAYENSEYTPTVGTLYLRATHLPADTLPIGLAFTSALDHLGIYQVDVIAPVDKGKGAAFAMADLLITAFPRGDLTYNGVKVRIKSVSPQPGTRDGAYYIVSVIINYQSITGN
tara:strand:- start:1990 stop:2406 length:417 start_codon:yes stop_codon:yes gene_type:complete